MGLMIYPPHPYFPKTSGGAHELRVLEKLQRDLGSGWRILCDVTTDPGNSRAPQLDFVALHPAHGICVIEAKATLWRTLGGAFQFLHRGKREWMGVRRSPWRQANDGVMALRQRLNRDLNDQASSFGATNRGLEVLRDLAEGYVPMAGVVAMLDMETPTFDGNTFDPPSQEGGRAGYHLACDGSLQTTILAALARDSQGTRQGENPAWVEAVWSTLVGGQTASARGGKGQASTTRGAWFDRLLLWGFLALLFGSIGLVMLSR